MTTPPAPAYRFEPRRTLGRTGFVATRLGIGDLADRSTPIADCVATIHRAMDYGLNLIDTAPMYEDGYSEQIVGAALRGRRDGVFVIDKIDQIDEAVAPQVDASLRRLNLEAVDLLVFHGLSAIEQWQRLAAPDGGMDQVARCIAAGKARFRGISAHNPDVLIAAVESGLCDVVMFPIGPFVDSRFISRVLPLTRRNQVGAVCFKTFGAGKLLGDTQGYGRPLQQRPRGKFSSGGELTGKPLLPHLSVTECVRYTLTCDPDVALLGMSFPNELDAAVAAAAEFQPLDEEQMASVRRRAAEAIADKGPCWWNPS